eukprot:1362451-Amorphochlora_amoeboformis.AAC.1
MIHDELRLMDSRTRRLLRVLPPWLENLELNSPDSDAKLAISQDLSGVSDGVTVVELKPPDRCVIMRIRVVHWSPFGLCHWITTDLVEIKWVIAQRTFQNYAIFSNILESFGKVTQRDWRNAPSVKSDARQDGMVSICL